jgi:DNA-directed RNA polymerase subunit alpha
MLEGLDPRVQTLELSDTYGKFSIEPLERGFGHTVGNALRRVLLAHVSGAAVTAVRIHGALHEFSTLPGVMENTTEIILNIRELAIKVHEPQNGGGADSEPWQLKIDAHGQCEVLGSDVISPPELEILNHEHHIAELTDKDAELTIDMWVECGKGYRQVDTRDRERRTLDAIPVDAVFTPVSRVAYNVEATRMGHRTDLDRLVLELWGDGSLPPNEAISEAAKLIHEHLSIFLDFTEREEREKEAVDQAVSVRVKALDYRIEDLDFSVRTYNCLKKEGIETLGALVEQSEADLMAIRNFGKRSLTEVVEKLAQFDLALNEPAGAGGDEDFDDTELALAESETDD